MVPCIHIRYKLILKLEYGNTIFVFFSRKYLIGVDPATERNMIKELRIFQAVKLW